MYGTYHPEDVTILLKDITGMVEPLGTKEREARIQSGVHYSEMLPLEYEPSPAYLEAYQDALERYADLTAEACAERPRRGIGVSGAGRNIGGGTDQALSEKILGRGSPALYDLHHPGPGD